MISRLRFLALVTGCAMSGCTSLPNQSDRMSFDDGYTCNFLPTAQMYLGRVYRTKDFLQFPGGIEEKQFEVTRQFKDEFDDLESFRSGGERRTLLQNVTLDAAIEIMELDLDPADVESIKADGGMSRSVGMTRQLDTHTIRELPDDRVDTIREWFETYRSSPQVSNQLRADWKFYVVREIRATRNLKYKVSKQSFDGLNVSAPLANGNSTGKVTREVGENWELIGDFDEELTFCMKVERLDVQK